LKIPIPANGKSLYFHIPFCSKKCPYCHFYVLPDQEELKRQFLEALELEWKRVSPLINPSEIVSLYFGGGTPTLVGAKAIQTILEWVRPPADCEITLEANPEETNLDLMRSFKQAGINRISLGVQSLDDTSLIVLERQHSAYKALHAIDAIAAAGFTNLSIDLMYDLPFQTLESWRKTLRQVSSLPITHLSLYNLTIEPHTPFHKRRHSLPLPTDELSLQMLQEAVSALEESGLQRYEISAFAKHGLFSRHNTGYWTARPFLGLGPSAFSYWEGKRFKNISHLQKYRQALQEGKSPVDFEEQLPYPRNLQELLAVHLRLLEGVDIAVFEARHGRLTAELRKTLSSLQDKGWLERQGDSLSLTHTGQLFYDLVAEAIV
jgi:oxygen-independent coproporphyrinogen III oxidase